METWVDREKKKLHIIYSNIFSIKILTFLLLYFPLRIFWSLYIITGNALIYLFNKSYLWYHGFVPHSKKLLVIFLILLFQLIDKEINPYVDEWEEKEIFPAHEVFKKLGNHGFLGVNYPVGKCSISAFVWEGNALFISKYMCEKPNLIPT